MFAHDESRISLLIAFFFAFFLARLGGGQRTMWRCRRFLWTTMKSPLYGCICVVRLGKPLGDLGTGEYSLAEVDPSLYSSAVNSVFPAVSCFW